MFRPDYMPQSTADCVVCGAGFVSREFLVSHFQRRHPDQIHLLRCGPPREDQSHGADRPADPFAPMIGAGRDMHRGASGSGPKMRAGPREVYIAGCADYPPMDEPTRGRRHAERGWAGFPERGQRGPAGGHGGLGEPSGFGDGRYGGPRGAYGGGGGDRGGEFAVYGAPRPSKRQREEVGWDLLSHEMAAAPSRRRIDGRLSGTAVRWNKEKVPMNMCMAVRADTIYRP